jgi:hypothetical protein
MKTGRQVREEAGALRVKQGEDERTCAAEEEPWMKGEEDEVQRACGGRCCSLKPSARPPDREQSFRHSDPSEWSVSLISTCIATINNFVSFV